MASPNISTDRAEDAGVRVTSWHRFIEKRSLSLTLKSPQQQVLGKDEDRNGESSRKRAGAAGDAEVRGRVGEPEEAHEAHRR